MENFVKYPRTLHLPHSPGKAGDDKTLKNTKHLENEEVVVTLKLDGENTSLYHNGFHERSLTPSYDESRTWVRNLQGQIGHLIPENKRICGENLFAKHSLEYNDLSSYFMAFSVWEDDFCLSWDNTESFIKELGLELAPVVYRGKYDQKAIDKAFLQYAKNHEGYVIRLAKSFKYEDFSKSVCKWVRADHVQTDKHWRHQALVKNQLKK